MFFLFKTLLEIGFHTLSLINSTYPSTIWDKSNRELRSRAREVFRVCMRKPKLRVVHRVSVQNIPPKPSLNHPHIPYLHGS
jgi:hypothetical protein